MIELEEFELYDEQDESGIFENEEAMRIQFKLIRLFG
jgi:hypothetical protein